MKKLFAILFDLLGLVLAGCVLALCLLFPDPEPVVLTPTDAANSTSQALMEALCAGDYPLAQTFLFGQPDLGTGREPEGRVGQLIWQAFLDSLEYEFPGECVSAGTGMRRQVHITCLDLTSVTETMGLHARDLLAERIALADSMAEIYDENGEYREAFVMDVLYLAALQSLFEDAETRTHTVTLNLVYQEDTWWVLPEQDLIRVISGGTAG